MRVGNTIKKTHTLVVSLLSALCSRTLSLSSSLCVSSEVPRPGRLGQLAVGAKGAAVAVAMAMARLLQLRLGPHQPPTRPGSEKFQVKHKAEGAPCNF